MLNLTEPTKDEKWVSKILIGGLLMVIPLVNIITSLFTTGYFLQSMKKGALNEEGLPEWSGNWGEYFILGLKYTVIMIIYMLLPMIICFVGGLGAVSLSAAADSGVGALLSLGGTFIIGILLALIIGFITPLALTHMVVEGEFGAAFRFGEIFGKLKVVFGNYLVTYLLCIVICFATAMVLGLIPFIGWILIPFAVFYLLAAFGKAYGQLYAEASKKA